MPDSPCSCSYFAPPLQLQHHLLSAARHATPQGNMCTLWSCACLALVYWLHASLHGNAQHLFVMFFQPFVPPLLMLWLWIANVRHWELARVDFDGCFSTRDRKLLPSRGDLFKVRCSLTTGFGLGAPGPRSSSPSL